MDDDLRKKNVLRHVIEPEGSPNPWANRGRVRHPWEITKIVLMTVTLIAPLRLGLALLLMVLMWATSNLALLGYRSRFDERGRILPIPKWRQKLMWPARLTARLVLLVFGYWHIRVNGNIDHEAPIIVCNHASWFDSFWIAFSRMPMPIAKISYRSHPFVGRWFVGAQSIFVDRHDPDSRKKTLEEIRYRVVEFNSNQRKRKQAQQQQLQQQSSDSSSRKTTEDTVLFPPLLVFPEATLTNNSCLISFKAGAFSAGLPVQPMVLQYVFRNCDPTWVFDSTLEIFLQLYHIACQFYNVLDVSYLDVHVPTEEERNNPILFARHVRAEMAKALGSRTSPHAFEDKSLLEQCVRIGVVPNFAIARLKAALKSSIPSTDNNHAAAAASVGVGLGGDLFKECVSVFSALDLKHDGQIDETEIGQELGTDLFGAMCLSGGDGISYLDLVVAVSLLSTETQAYQAKELETESGPLDLELFEARVVHLSFAIFDEDNDGRVSFRDMFGACERICAKSSSSSSSSSSNNGPSSDSKNQNQEEKEKERSSNGHANGDRDRDRETQNRESSSNWIDSVQSWLATQMEEQEQDEREFQRGDESFKTLIQSRQELVRLSSKVLFDRLKSIAAARSRPKRRRKPKT